MTKFVQPFDGKPATQHLNDDEDKPTFIVTPRVLTPLRAKLADLGGAAASIISGAAAILHLHTQSTPPEWHAAAVGGAMLAYPILKGAGRLLLKKRVRIILTPSLFKIKRWNGWKIYDRSLPHKIGLIQHDWTQVEQDRHELAIKRAQAAGDVIGKKRYFGESYHLIFEYVGQRRDVMSIYGHKDALAVLARLKACDEILNSATHMGDGLPLSPEEQWNRQPGDIPLREDQSCIK